MGNAHLELQELDNALVYHNKDLQVGKSRNYEDIKARALSNLGRVYTLQGQFTSVSTQNCSLL